MPKKRSVMQRKAKNDLNNAKAETQSYLKNLEKQTGSLNEQISDVE